MKTIFLPSKQIGQFYIDVYDDGFVGVLSGEFYVITPHNKLEPMSKLIEQFRFPKSKGVCDCRIVNYIQGYNKELFDKIEYYDTKTLESTK